MQIQCEPIERVCAEQEVWEQQLDLNQTDILELGCGTAALTRKIAESSSSCRVTAMEVDAIQHAKNMQITDLKNVHFVAGSAEAIASEDNAYDVVLMFKSLHHVPLDRMDAALNEIRRVLRAEGRAYISEPIFAGDFNAILRLFHNEEIVRKAAFSAVKKAVDDGRFTLVDEVFFLSPMRFANFPEFEQLVIAVTHSQHRLSNELFQEVKQAFENKMSDDGANFLMPMRVDILEVRA